MATFDALFRGVGKDLVDLFGSACTYHQAGTLGYDPATGDVTPVVTDYAVKVGVEQITRSEEGGAGEALEAIMWFSHVTLPLEPRTGDSVTYQSRVWKVVGVEPEYAGDAIIAFKLRVRAS